MKLEPGILSQGDKDYRRSEAKTLEEAKSLRSKRRKWIAMVAIIILLLIMTIL